MEWRTIDSAPRGNISSVPPKIENGPRIDIFAKRWRAEDDTFLYRRFTDVRYVYGLDGHGGWEGIDGAWKPTHWMPLPEPPK